MSQLKTKVLFLLLSSLAACGRQVVEFKLDAGADAGAIATADAGNDAGSNPGNDAGFDAGIDAGFDAGFDAGIDAGIDAGFDAGVDAGIDAGVGVAPTIITTLPANGATGTALDTSVSATFSEAMNAATLNKTTFTLAQGATPISGSVSYSAATSTATFTPAAALRNSLVYTALVTTGAQSAGGLALATSDRWSFTTTAPPPTVTATTPLNLATNVSINERPTATFSEAMDPTTITAVTFTVMQGTTPVAGVVTLDAATNTATFTPSTALGLDILYTATVTTGAKSTGGAALAANDSWGFTTAACSQATVVLGSATTFAVLAGSTVTNTGQTSVTGDLGVSPGTAITGFPPGTVNGNQHADDPTAAQAIADLTTAYNDAAGRSLCPVSVAGNLGGQTLTPGLYKSTSSLSISSGDLTLDAQGDGDGIFIFQMASTLTTTAGRQVILANGAKASNIFWQVGSSATVGTTSAFQGTIMADQAVTLDTLATLDGRALARIAATSLDSNTVVKPAP